MVTALGYGTKRASVRTRGCWPQADSIAAAPGGVCGRLEDATRPLPGDVDFHVAPRGGEVALVNPCPSLNHPPHLSLSFPRSFSFPFHST